MLDQQLIFGEDARPAITPNANRIIWPFPELATPNLLDLQSQIDWNKGQPMYAHFQITETFAGAAENVAAMCVVVDNATNLINVLSTPSLVLSRGPDQATISLVAGQIVTLVVPPLNTIAYPGDEGKQYIALGMEVVVPTTDWTGGAVTCWLSDQQHPVRLSAYPTGF